MYQKFVERQNLTCSGARQNESEIDDKDYEESQVISQHQTKDKPIMFKSNLFANDRINSLSNKIQISNKTIDA